MASMAAMSTWQEYSRYRSYNLESVKINMAVLSFACTCLHVVCMWYPRASALHIAHALTAATTLAAFAPAMAAFLCTLMSSPSRSGWHVGQQYTVRAAMLHVFTGVLQRPQWLWL